MKREGKGAAAHRPEQNGGSRSLRPKLVCWEEGRKRTREEKKPSM